MANKSFDPLLGITNTEFMGFVPTEIFLMPQRGLQMRNFKYECLCPEGLAEAHKAK